MSSDWTNSEKKIARRVFEAARLCELDEIVQVFKAMAARAGGPDDMWATEAYLAKTRQAFGRKYDFRYSQLELVFSVLIREGRITRADLSGFSEERMNRILRIASL